MKTPLSLKAFLLSSFCFLLLTCVAQARPVIVWNYEKLTQEADLIVIATPTAVRDTIERTMLMAIVPTIGVETTFEISSVLKGQIGAKSVVFHHLREAGKPVYLEDGPNFISFDPKEKKSFLLFLKREDDGRFASLTGQIDPDVGVKLLGPPPVAPPEKSENAPAPENDEAEEKDATPSDAMVKLTRQMAEAQEAWAKTVTQGDEARKDLALLQQKTAESEEERQKQETVLKAQLRMLEAQRADLQAHLAALKAKAAALKRSAPKPPAGSRSEDDRSEKKAEQLVLKIRPPLELVEANQHREGGLFSMILRDARLQTLKLCVDSHLGPAHFGEPRLLVGTTRSDDPEALLAASGGKTEKLVLSLLYGWMSNHVLDSQVTAAPHPDKVIRDAKDAAHQRFLLVQQVVEIFEKRNPVPRLQFRLIADDNTSNALTMTSLGGEKLTVRHELLLDETSVSSASVTESIDSLSMYSISVKFTEAGAGKFAEITGANVGRRLGLVFDGELLAAPPITGTTSEFSVDTKGSGPEKAAALGKAMSEAIQVAKDKRTSTEDR